MGAMDAEEVHGGHKECGYCYRDKSKVVHEGLTRFFNHQTFSDLTVVDPDGNKIHCHQLVLSSCSRRFSDMLDQGQLAGEELPVRGVDGYGLYLVLRFFYTGECHMDHTSVIPVYDAAHRLDVPGLAAACDVYSQSVLGPGTACSLLQQAQRFALNDYAISCSRIIRNSFDAVIQSEDFLTVDRPTLMKVLEDNIPHHNEGSVFRAAWRWGMSSLARMQDMPKVFKVVKVPNLSMQDLVNLAGPLPGPAPQPPRNRGLGSVGGATAAPTAAGSQFMPASGRAAESCAAGLEVLTPAKLREAQDTLIKYMLSGLDLVKAVRLTVQHYGSGDGEPAPPAAPCLQLGQSGHNMGGSHALPPARISGAGPPPGHLQGATGGQHLHNHQHPQQHYHNRVTHHLDSMPSHPATAPAMPATAAAWHHLQHTNQQHDSPEVANSCAASGGQDDDMEHDGERHQPEQPRGGHPQAGRAVHGGGGGRRGDGQQGTVVGGGHPSGTAVSGTAGSGLSRDDAVSGARRAMAGGRGERARGNGHEQEDDHEHADSVAAHKTAELLEVIKKQLNPALNDMGGRQVVLLIDPKTLMGSSGNRGPPGAVRNGSGSTRLVCQVDKCSQPLSGLKEHNQRLRICEQHYRALEVQHEGVAQRFCQPCGHLHPVDEFESDKRACRSRCATEARRRKRSRPDEAGDEEDAPLAGYGQTAGLAGAGVGNAAAPLPLGQGAGAAPKVSTWDWAVQAEPQRVQMAAAPDPGLGVDAVGTPSSTGSAGNVPCGAGAGHPAMPLPPRPQPQAQRMQQQQVQKIQYAGAAGGQPRQPARGGMLPPQPQLPNVPHFQQPQQQLVAHGSVPLPRRQLQQPQGPGRPLPPAGAAPAQQHAPAYASAPAQFQAADSQQQQSAQQQQRQQQQQVGSAHNLTRHLSLTGFPVNAPNTHPQQQPQQGQQGHPQPGANMRPAGPPGQQQEQQQRGQYQVLQLQSVQDSQGASRLVAMGAPAAGGGVAKLIFSMVPLDESAGSGGGGGGTVAPLHVMQTADAGAMRAPPARQPLTMGPGQGQPPAGSAHNQHQLQTHRGSLPSSWQPGSSASHMSSSAGAMPQGNQPQQQQVQTQQRQGGVANAGQPMAPTGGSGPAAQGAQPHVAGGHVVAAPQQQQMRAAMPSPHAAHVPRQPYARAPAASGLMPPPAPVHGVMQRQAPDQPLYQAQQQQQAYGQPQQGQAPAANYPRQQLVQGAVAAYGYAPQAFPGAQSQPADPRLQQQEKEQQQALQHDAWQQHQAASGMPRQGQHVLYGQAGQQGPPYNGMPPQQQQQQQLHQAASMPAGAGVGGVQPRVQQQQLDGENAAGQEGEPTTPRRGLLRAPGLPAPGPLGAGGSAAFAGLADTVSGSAAVSSFDNRLGLPCELRVSINGNCSFGDLHELVNPGSHGLFDSGLISPNTELFNILNTGNGAEDTMGPMLDLLGRGESMYDDTANTAQGGVVPPMLPGGGFAAGAQAGVGDGGAGAGGLGGSMAQGMAAALPL